MRHLDSLQLTRFVELLTATELFYDTRLIEFAFEFLDRTLDVLSFFYRNDNHCIHLLSCTQGRDRTGTVSHWCLRPTRLPIPPPGLRVQRETLPFTGKKRAKLQQIFELTKFLATFFA